jgi:hypothetical protein
MENQLKNIEKTKPNLSKQAFWDVKFEDIDYQKYDKWVIERIFEFGTKDDVYEIIKFYGEEYCKITLTNSKFIRLNAIAIASLLFSIPREKFKCFLNRPSHVPF